MKSNTTGFVVHFINGRKFLQVLSALDDEHDPIAKLQEIIDSNLVHYEKDSVFQVFRDCCSVLHGFYSSQYYSSNNSNPYTLN